MSYFYNFIKRLLSYIGGIKWYKMVYFSFLNKNSVYKPVLYIYTSRLNPLK